jgi:hypothetical protein
MSDQSVENQAESSSLCPFVGNLNGKELCKVDHDREITIDGTNEEVEAFMKYDNFAHVIGILLLEIKRLREASNG